MFQRLLTTAVVCGAVVLLFLPVVVGQEAPPAQRTEAAEPSPSTTTERAEPAQSEEAPATAPASTPSPAPSPAPSPTDDGGSGRRGRVTAEEILREFQKERPVARPLLPRGSRTGDSDQQPGGGQLSSHPRLPDGFFLVDRVGVLTQRSDWWVFVFISDNNPEKAPDPPMKLLPNQMLERAVRESEGAGRAVEFIVSGEITDFMGENYLLLRKLMRKRDLGNLSK